MPYVFADRVWCYTATAGTGTITLGAAVLGYRTPSAAGLAVGTDVAYTLVDGVSWEVGSGTLGTTTITRDFVESSSIGGGKITLTGSASVFLTVAAGTMNAVAGIASIAALRASSLMAMVVQVEGYYTAADGGEGRFFLIESDTTSADNGGTIIVDAAGRRWYRGETDGESLSVLWFGAKGDGVTDDTAAINNTIAAGRVAFLPGRNYTFLASGTLNVPVGGAVIGPEGKATIVTAAASFPLFSLNGTDTSLKRLILQNAAKTGGVDILLNVTAGAIERIYLEDIESFSPWGCLDDTGTGNTPYISLYATRVRSRGTRGATAFNIVRGFAFLQFVDCLADFLGQPVGLSDHPGFVIDNAVIATSGPVGGAQFTRCFANGNSRGAAITANWGFSFRNTSSVWLTDCMADSCDGYGFVFSNMNHVWIENSIAGLVNGPGWTFDTCLYVQGSNVRVFGRSINGIPGAATAHGLSLLTNVGFASFSNLVVDGVFGDGINMPVQAAPINLTGGRISNCTGWGIDTSGTYALLVTGMQFAGNALGNYNLNGSFHYLRACQINSGAVIDAGPGPVAG